jgi:uncharacterized membrane protein
MNSLENWILAIVVALLTVMIYLVPLLSRPDLFFAVTVDPKFRQSAEARRIQRTYSIWTILSGVCALALAFAGVRWAPLLLVFTSIVSLSIANRQTLPFAAPPNPIREATLSLRSNNLPGGWLLALLPFAILILSALYVKLQWDHLPSQFPVHWGIDGQANRWVARTPRAVFGFYMSGFVLCGVLVASNILILRSRRIALQGSSLDGETRFRRMNSIVLLISSYVIAATFGLLPLRTMSSGPFGGLGSTAILLFAVLPIVLVMSAYMIYGQGGSRLSGPSTATAPVGDRTPDQCWILGQIYFNREDPALFVEKRFGFGYTLNFANPWSFVFLVAAVAVPIVITRFSS